MATYTFDIRLNKIVPHTARLSIEADNIADAIQQVRASEGDGACWEPEGNGFWDEDLFVDALQRHAEDRRTTFPDAVGRELNALGLAWFKRDEAARLAA